MLQSLCQKKRHIKEKRPNHHRTVFDAPAVKAEVQGLAQAQNLANNFRKIPNGSTFSELRAICICTNFHKEIMSQK